LERFEWKFAKPLFNLWVYWTRAIDELEKSWIESRGKQRILVGEQLDTLSNTTPATLPSSPDSKALECIICMDNLAYPEKSLIQLPCHSSHLFHRDCIQVSKLFLPSFLILQYSKCQSACALIQHWLEGHLGCPIFQAEVQLLPWEYPC
jgi:hypothetical protein